MDFKSNESSDRDSASADFYTEESYSLEVWLEVFPHLGKHTLKRIKSRIESGQYQLENFIPVDVLRRKLQQNIVELEYLVRCFGVQNKCVATNLKNMKKSHAMLNPKSQKQPIMITKCRHRKFVSTFTSCILFQKLLSIFLTKSFRLSHPAEIDLFNVS